ncbi:MAG: DUF3085 domain-containing protein [Opitutaceae bacterium]
MKLYFEKAKVAAVIAAVENGTGHQVPYTGEPWGKPEDHSPGIMIVGDDGVYIIGNEDAEEAPIKSGLIAYAKGCNPRVDEDWWGNKRASFGGDDGAEFLELEEAKRLLLLGQEPFVEFTPNQVIWGSE